MTQAKPRFRTIEEYAALDRSDLPQGRYELVDGEIIQLPAESDLNVIIAGFLFATLLQFAQHYLIRQKTEIFVTSRVTSRFPDLMVLSEAGFAAIEGAPRSAVKPEMPPPQLIVEIVSPGEPGKENYDRDYVEKPEEYAARGILDFWRVDPGRSVVTVLRLENGTYQSRNFRGSDRVVSHTFSDLQLTAEQILRAGR